MLFVQSVEAGKLAQFRDAGVNRLSLGVQVSPLKPEGTVGYHHLNRRVQLVDTFS